MSGLILKNVRKSFGRQTVISGISLAVNACELLVLLGPSGCGKSTLLRLIAGLEEVDSGEIYINGKRVDHRRPKERNVALVFQNYSLYPHMTVAGNLAFPLVAAGYKKSVIRQRIQEVAGMIGLSERLKDKPSQLSGGQRQRVALGRAVVRKSAVFLLDEPLSNLDTELRIRMRREIVALHRRLERATIHVTHDQTEALSMADRIAVMDAGRIIQIGSPGELYDDPNCAFVAQFLGHPKTVLLTADVKDNRLTPFDLPIDRLKCRTIPSKVSLALRPEWIEIDERGHYLAEVIHCEFLGDQYAITLGFGGYRLAVSHVKKPLQVGKHIRFSFDPARILLFDPQSGDRLR